MMHPEEDSILTNTNQITAELKGLLSTDTTVPDTTIVSKVLDLVRACLQENHVAEARVWSRYALTFQGSKTLKSSTVKSVVKMWYDAGYTMQAGDFLHKLHIGIDREFIETDAELQTVNHKYIQQRESIWDRLERSANSETLRNPSNESLESIKEALRERCWQEKDLWEGNSEIETTRAMCFQSLSNNVTLWKEAFGGTGMFGIKAMVFDKPQRRTHAHGDLNYQESEKSCTLFMQGVMGSGKHPDYMENLFSMRAPATNPLVPGKLYSKPSISMPFGKFVTVRALLAMDCLERCQDISERSFVNHVEFAVSHRWLSEQHPDPLGQTLERLKDILANTDGIEMDDGVFVDYCCIPQGLPKDNRQLKLVKQSMDELYGNVHVIFLPGTDYFVRSWCWFEYMSWMLSPRPTQALGDRMDAMLSMTNKITMMLFGRMVFLLDRPELSSLPLQWGQHHTKHNEGDDASTELFFNGFGNRLSAAESSQTNTCLIESLSRIIWKCESAIRRVPVIGPHPQYTDANSNAEPDNSDMLEMLFAVTHHKKANWNDIQPPRSAIRPGGTQGQIKQTALQAPKRVVQNTRNVVYQPISAFNVDRTEQDPYRNHVDKIYGCIFGHLEQKPQKHPHQRILRDKTCGEPGCSGRCLLLQKKCYCHFLWVPICPKPSKLLVKCTQCGALVDLELHEMHTMRKIQERQKKSGGVMS